jgi:hypothetical protein
LCLLEVTDGSTDEFVFEQRAPSFLDKEPNSW